MSDDPVKLARTMSIAMDKTFKDSTAANSWRAVANALEAAYAKIAELERERDDWKSRAQQFQRERAELSDALNGTPCAEIRWQYELDSLRAKLDADGDEG